MLSKLLLKSFLLRSFVRLFIPADTAEDLTASYTKRFDAVAKEQTADAAQFAFKEAQAAAKRQKAENAAKAAAKASANIRKMLEADE